MLPFVSYNCYVLDDQDNKLLILSNSDLNKVLSISLVLWQDSDHDYWIYGVRDDDSEYPAVRLLK